MVCFHLKLVREKMVDLFFLDLYSKKTMHKRSAKSFMFAPAKSIPGGWAYCVLGPAVVLTQNTDELGTYRRVA